MHTHGTDVFQNAVPFLPFRQFPAFLQVGKFLIHHAGDHNIGYELHHQLDGKVQDKVSRQQQCHDLHDGAYALAHQNPTGADITFLVGLIDGAFIVQQIRAC